jgi:hypothetical protein
MTAAGDRAFPDRRLGTPEGGEIDAGMVATLAAESRRRPWHEELGG